MVKAKQKRKNKPPEVTFTTSPETIVEKKANTKETVNAPPKREYQRGCRIIQKY